MGDNIDSKYWTSYERTYWNMCENGLNALGKLAEASQNVAYAQFELGNANQVLAREENTLRKIRAQKNIIIGLTFAQAILTEAGIDRQATIYNVLLHVGAQGLAEMVWDGMV